MNKLNLKKCSQLIFCLLVIGIASILNIQQTKIVRASDTTCIQEITPAKNSVTGECKNFSTPCDVPAGWNKVDVCSPTIPKPISKEPGANYGIWQPTLTPNEAIIGKTIKVSVRAEIGYGQKNFVKVYETNKAGKLLKVVATLHDNGNTIHTGDFTINKKIAGKYYYKIGVSYKQTKNKYFTNNLQFEIYKPIPVGLLMNLNKYIEKLDTNFKQYLKKYGETKARQIILAEAKKNKHVKNVTLSGRSMSLLYDGIIGIVELDSNNGTDGLQTNSVDIKLK